MSFKLLFQHQETLDRGRNPLIQQTPSRLRRSLPNFQRSRRPTSLGLFRQLSLTSPTRTSSPLRPARLDLLPTTPPRVLQSPTLRRRISSLPDSRSTEAGTETRSRGKRASSPSDQLVQRIFKPSIDPLRSEVRSLSRELFEIPRFAVGTFRSREGCRGVRE